MMKNGVLGAFLRKIFEVTPSRTLESANLACTCFISDLHAEKRNLSFNLISSTFEVLEQK